MLGADRVFSIAISLMSVFALICAVIDDSIIALIVFRALQGVAASFLIPSAFAVAAGYFKGPQYVYALTALILALTGTFGLGLILGGAFSASSIGYKGLYYLTFALGSAVAILLYLFAVPLERTEEHKKMKIKNLDIYGSMMFVVGLLLIILAFTQSGETWNQASVYVPLPVGVMVLVGALIFELWYVSGYQDKVKGKLLKDQESNSNAGDLDKSKDEDGEGTFPSEMEDWRYNLEVLFPREALKVPNFIQFITATSAIYLSMMALIITEGQYFLYVENDSPLISGLKAFPFSIGFLIGTLTSSEELIYKISMKWVLISSQSCVVGVIAWISQHKFDDGNSYWIYELVPIVLYGWLTSIYMCVYFNATMRNTPVHLQGAVSGLLQTASQVAICLGTAVVSSILGELTVAYTEEDKEALKKRINNALYLNYATIAFAVVVMLTIKDRKSVESTPDEKPKALIVDEDQAIVEVGDEVTSG